MDAGGGGAGGGAAAALHASPALSWQADELLKKRLEALNSSGRHVTNITNINGTTYADIEVRQRAAGGCGASAHAVPLAALGLSLHDFMRLPGTAAKGALLHTFVLIS